MNRNKELEIDNLTNQLFNGEMTKEQHKILRQMFNIVWKESQEQYKQYLINEVLK